MIISNKSPFLSIDKEIHAFVISIWGDFVQCYYYYYYYYYY